MVYVLDSYILRLLLHLGATEKMRCFNRTLGDWSVSQVTRSLERPVAGPSANVKFMISEYF